MLSASHDQTDLSIRSGLDDDGQLISASSKKLSELAIGSDSGADRVEPRVTVLRGSAAVCEG